MYVCTIHGNKKIIYPVIYLTHKKKNDLDYELFTFSYSTYLPYLVLNNNISKTDGIRRKLVGPFCLRT